MELPNTKPRFWVLDADPSLLHFFCYVNLVNNNIYIVYFKNVKIWFKKDALIKIFLHIENPKIEHSDFITRIRVLACIKKTQAWFLLGVLKLAILTLVV